MKALKIETNGKIELIEITGNTVDEQVDCIWGILGGYFDIVRLAYGAVMLVNDEGLLRGLPVNQMAMRISKYPMLVGTALLVGLEMTDDGEIFASCPERFETYAKEST